MAKKHEPRTLGVPDAARILGLSKAMVKRHAAQGRIGEFVAGRYLFSKSELQAFAKVPRKPGPKRPRKP